MKNLFMIIFGLGFLFFGLSMTVHAQYIQSAVVKKTEVSTIAPEQAAPTSEPSVETLPSVLGASYHMADRKPGLNQWLRNFVLHKHLSYNKTFFFGRRWVDLELKLQGKPVLYLATEVKKFEIEARFKTNGAYRFSVTRRFYKRD